MKNNLKKGTPEYMLQELKADCDVLKDKVQQANEVKKDIEKRYEELIDKATELDKKIDEYDKLLSEIDKKIDSLNDKIVEVLESKEVNSKDMEKYFNEIDSLIETKAKTQSEKIDTEFKKVNLLDKIEDLEKVKEITFKKALELENKYKSLENKKDELEEKIKDIEKKDIEAYYNGDPVE